MKRFAVFLPLLLLYLLLVLLLQDPILTGDEPRYLGYAQNILQGFFTTREELLFWSGPGYPLLLTPFVLLGIPLLAAKLLNAIMLFLAVGLFDRALLLYVPERTALVWAYVFGLYWPLYTGLAVLVTEVLSTLLVCMFLYSFCRAQRLPERRLFYSVAAGVSLGYLALTKIFFGYVIASCLILFSFGYLWRRRAHLRRSAAVCLVAMALCSPYLLYTYHMTGRVFYWGNSGGLSLYWMSDGELGDWHSEADVLGSDNFGSETKAFFNNIADLDYVRKDDALKRQAIVNIREHPMVFAENWIANVGRMLFSYPYSFTPQKITTLFYMVPAMFVVVIAVLFIYPSILARSIIPAEIVDALLLGGVALGGSSLLSAYPRHFYLLLPIFGIWIVFVATKVLSIQIQKRG